MDNELVYFEMFLGPSMTKLGNFSDSHGHHHCESKELSLRRVARTLKCLCQKINSSHIIVRLQYLATT